VLQLFSPSFDAAIAQTMVSLTSGACLVLAEPRAVLPGPDLASLLQAEAITMVAMPPSALAALPEDSYPALQTLVVGGEACPADLAWRWASSRRLINAYGPTEMTIRASAGVLRQGEAVSIGRPIERTRAYVLDGRLEPVAMGLAGELYLTGLGLARGYLGQPEATAGAFVPDRFCAQAGGRLYRTGDRVRRLPDGRLEFLGRMDRQVKVRGFRIELGEVEVALARHPAVGETVAMVREDRTGDRRLVACVVPREGEPAVAELRSFLRGLLPEYMIPSHFVFRDRLPLLPSGKVDLQSLARETGAPKAVAGTTLPRNPWEAALAEVFAEVLGLPQVGVQDDFFELGGHSLLAVGLKARIEKRFGRQMPLALLFEGPTVEQLAVRLFNPSRYAAWSPLVAMQPEGAKTPFFCVHPLGGGVVGYYRYLMRRLGPDRAFYGLQARGLEEYAGLAHPSIEEMASEYVARLRTVQPQGPYLLGGASFGGAIAFEMAQQLTQQGEEVGTLALIDAQVKPLVTEGETPEGEEPPPLNADEFAYDMARSLAALAEKQLRLTYKELQGLPEERFLTVLLERLREAGLVDEGIDVPWLRRYRESLSARIAAGSRYRARPYPGRIDLFRTTRSAPGEPPAESPGAAADPTLGWSGIALGGVEVHWISATHQTMLLEPAVMDVAALLKECFRPVDKKVEARGGPIVKKPVEAERQEQRSRRR
jgi:thioesterase domain-containing protein/acyl carrier protein